jgi:NTP pyrophosphatase (non-canonical NTP hydrolase)
MRQLQKKIHELARSKGWYDHDLPGRTPLEVHMLVVSEVAEATEAVRKGEAEYYFTEGGKPEGEAVELADAIIRILDYAEYSGWDMGDIIERKHEYNKTRPYRHGGKLK